MKKYALLWVLFLIGLNVTAQEIYFDLSYLTESNREEFFYGDPHYDKAGNLLYYSLNDNMRMYFTCDEKGNVVQKDWYLFVESDFEWIIIKSVVYTYKNDRLKEVILYSRPEVNSSQLKHHELEKTFVKEIVYDDKLNTETVTTYLADARKQKRIMQKDTTTVIRYLNENGLVYKAITCDRWIERPTGKNSELYFMQLYQYDSDSRLTKIEKYKCNIASSAWLLNRVSEMEYAGGQTVYSFFKSPQTQPLAVTADDPFGLLQQHKAYKKQEAEKEKQRKMNGEEPPIAFEVIGFNASSNESDQVKKLTYTLSFDDMQRITGREVAVNEMVFSRSRYVYDAQGRTSVVYESSVFDKFADICINDIQDYEVEYNLKKINVPFKYKYTVNYSAEGNDCGQYDFWRRRDGEADWMHEKEFRYCYIADKLFSTFFHKEFDYNGAVSEEHRVEFNYAPDGLSGECIAYRESEEMEYSSGEMEIITKELPYAKIVFRMDKNHNRIDQKKFFYDEGSQQWIFASDGF